MEGQTDAQLVTLARAGDASAFCQLVERSQVIASVMAFRLIADRETIREVIQEATLQAFLSLDRLRDTTRFKPWFYGIVLNVCRTWLREHNTRTLSLEALTTEWQTATQSPLLVAPDPHELVEEQELRRLVQETVRGLSPNTSSVIWLFYYEQLSIQEIAARLDISLSAVRNRLHKGRNELRRQLQIAYPDMVQRKPSTQRPIRGTQEWTRCELEVEVPGESISIAMGLRVFGTGQVWLADIDLDVVGEDLASTALQ
jgi:RNA polymerase sigma factor (sigma-70 family)